MLPDSVLGTKNCQQLKGKKSMFKKATHAIENGSLAPEDQFNGSLEIKHMLCKNAYRIYKDLTFEQQLYKNKLNNEAAKISFQEKEARTDASLQG